MMVKMVVVLTTIVCYNSKNKRRIIMYGKSKSKSKLTAKQKTLPPALKKKIMNSKSKKKK